MEYIEVNLKLAPKEPFTGILIARLAEIGFDTFEEHAEGCKGWIPKPDFDPVALHEEVEEVRPQLESIEYTVDSIPDQNWNALWESNFQPVRVKNCIIRAPFHEKPDDATIDIVIEPKMSFGTGHHETTALVAGEMLEMSFRDCDVLDMGCGTGILAILARHLGARKVTGIDIDEWAYTNTLENIERNGVPDIRVLQGGAECLGDQEFNIILANINRNIIVRDLPRYHAVLQSGGVILLSGFLDVDADKIRESILPLGYTQLTSQTLNHWCLLSFRKE